MKAVFTILMGVLLSLSATAVFSSAPLDQRTFLFISEPNAKAWKFLVENPQDRQQVMSQAIAKLGGEIVSYYFGLGDGRNYIIVSLPDDKELLQAIYLTRLADDMLKSYQMIELLSSAEMLNALKRVSQVKAVDNIK